MTPDLRDNILKYYDARKPPAAAVVTAEVSEKKANRKDAKARADWQKVLAEVEALRQAQVPLATAGGLVFAGEGNGWFRAYDARNGRVLWSFNASAGVSSSGTVPFSPSAGDSNPDMTRGRARDMP